MTDPVQDSNRYSWGRSRPFNDFSGFFREIFKERVQKISIDAGFTCPNRDGTKGTGGCSFCDNKTFNPLYCQPQNSITHQLNQGIAFFKKRYPGQKYLAYFQAYSNTYGQLELLKNRYSEALLHPDVVGLVIGTRPDCVSLELLDYLDALTDEYFVSLEFGIESTLDRTLKRINRGHDFNTAVTAFKICENRKFFTGLHLILGLPGEDRYDCISHAEELNKLNFNFLKLHQMQIIRGTAMEREFVTDPRDFMELTPASYVDLVIEFLEKLKPSIIVERFISESPRNKLIAPKWGLKNYEFVNLLEQEMIKRKTYQGRLIKLV